MIDYSILSLLFSIIFIAYIFFSIRSIKKSTISIENNLHFYEKRIEIIEIHNAALTNQISLDIKRIQEIEKILSMIIVSGGSNGSDNTIH